MTIAFPASKARGRHLYCVWGLASFLRHPDGRAASDSEADAMAQGYIPSIVEKVEEGLAVIETGSDTERAIWRAFSAWAMGAKSWEYGAYAVWQSYEVRRSGVK